MKSSKLRRIHVIIIGAAVCLIVGVGMFFVLIKPANEQLAKETARFAQYEPTGTQLYVDQQQADLNKAIQEVDNAQSDLDRYAKAKMPVLSFADAPNSTPGSGRAQGMFALWQEQNIDLAPTLTRWIMRKSKVTLASGFTVPAPPVNPNDPSFEQDFIPVSLGKIRVRGSYKNIMAHLKGWNNCNRLVDISNVSFTGNSPNLECEYDCNVYLMPKFKADKSKPLGIAGAAGQVGGVPGAPAMPSAPPPPPPPAPAAGSAPA